MKKFKIFALTATLAFGGLAMTSCGGNSKAQTIVNDAIKRVRVDMNSYYYLSGQIQLTAKQTVTIDEGTFIVDITWEGTPAERWTALSTAVAQSDGKYYVDPILPAKGEEDIPYSLVATATYEGKTAKSDSFEGFLVAPNSELMTVAEAKAAEEGTPVTVEGIAKTAFGEGQGFYVCDSTGCIFNYTKGSHVGKFSYGDKIRVTGNRTANSKTINNQSVRCLQIEYLDAALVEKGPFEIPTDTAKTATVDEILGWSKDPTDSNFVNHTGELIKVNAKIAAYRPGTYVQWELMDDNNSYVNFYSTDSGATYDEVLADYENKECEVYIVIHDIHTSSSGKVNWRTVPLKWSLAA